MVQAALFTIDVIFVSKTGFKSLAAVLSADSYHPHLQHQSMHDHTAGLSICPRIQLISQNAVAGVAPGAPTLVLPDMETRLSQLEQSVGLLLAGAPLPADAQRAQACTQVSPQPLCLSAFAFAVYAPR